MDNSSQVTSVSSSDGDCRVWEMMWVEAYGDVVDFVLVDFSFLIDVSLGSPSLCDDDFFIREVSPRDFCLRNDLGLLSWMYKRVSSFFNCA